MLRAEQQVLQLREASSKPRVTDLSCPATSVAEVTSPTLTAPQRSPSICSVMVKKPDVTGYGTHKKYCLIKDAGKRHAIRENSNTTGSSKKLEGIDIRTQRVYITKSKQRVLSERLT